MEHHVVARIADRIGVDRGVMCMARVRSRWSAWCAVLAAMTLLVSACGDDDSAPADGGADDSSIGMHEPDAGAQPDAGGEIDRDGSVVAPTDGSQPGETDAGDAGAIDAIDAAIDADVDDAA